jgi:hypothetical protein
LLWIYNIYWIPGSSLVLGEDSWNPFFRVNK